MKKQLVFAVLFALFLMPAFSTVSTPALANASGAVALGPDPGAAGPNVYPLLDGSCQQVGQVLFDAATGLFAVQVGGTVSTGTYTWVPAFCGGTIRITSGPMMGLNGTIVFGSTCITAVYGARLVTTAGTFHF